MVRRALLGVAFAGALYAIFGWSPRGPILILQVALPWITLFFVRKFRPALSINGSRASDLAACIWLPGIALTLRAVYDASPVHWQAPAVMTLLGAALLAYGVARADPDSKTRGWALVSSVLMFGFYGYGASMIINAYLDFRSPEVYMVKILDKRIAADRGHARYLTIERWGPKTSVDQVKVSNSLYDALKIGDTACVNVYPGALRVAWYALSPCPVVDSSRDPA